MNKMTSAFRTIAQDYCGLTPKDKGCNTWDEMQQKMANELTELINKILPPSPVDDPPDPDWTSFVAGFHAAQDCYNEKYTAEQNKWHMLADKHISNAFSKYKQSKEDIGPKLDNQQDKSSNTIPGIDAKIATLLSITDEFIFPAFYSHTNKLMWKIVNVYTKYNEETFVLCGVDEGIEKALDLAVLYISQAKELYYSLTANLKL